ncbi:MAG: SH3 domain-containing protein [Thermomicrobiales bacterium]
MTTLLSRVHRGLFIAVAALLMLSTIAPTLAIAQEGGDTAALGTPDAGTVPETTEVTEAPVEQGVPWAQPIDYGVVVNNLNVGGLPGEGLAVRVAASPDATVLGRLWEGQRVEVTSQKVWSGDTPYYTVNYGDGGGYVNANFILLDSEAAPIVTEAPAETIAPTEEPWTEVPVETVAPTDVVTDVPVETVAPTEVVTDIPVETAAPTDVPATEVPTNVVVPIGTIDATVPAAETEAPATEPATDGAAGTPMVTETAPAEDVETPADANGTPAVTVVETETTVATDDTEGTPATSETAASTETPAETAGTPVASVTDEAPADDASTPVASASETPAETATPTGPDLSKAIGSATVTGTNGEGIRCRVSADNDAATIVVLAEGTVVQVFDTSTPGWLQISCGGQLGYGDVNYLYTGGASDDQINQGGRLTVSGTGGGGVNCRSGAGTNYGVIALISEGTALTIRGQATNGWTPVTCNGQNGYISSQYIAVSAVTGGESGGGTTGTTTVTGTGGDGVRCRTAASTSSNTIMLVPEGTAVSVRGASSGGWTPVTCNGQNGYISSQYLGSITAGTNTPAATKTATATTAPGGSTGTGWVKVTGSGGGVNCRSGAGTNYGVIALISEGGTVQTRSGSTNGWQAVICGGQNGFILADLTSSTTGGSGTGTTPTPTATATTTPDGGSGATGTATVANTGGDGVYCRVSVPSGNPITILSEGSTVTLRGTASNGWQPVICGGQNGYVSSQYLTLGSGTTPTATATTTPGSGTGSGLANGDHAKTQADVNLRYDPSTNSAPAMTVPIGIVVLITGTPSNGFYPVNYDGLTGWISGDYLAKTSDALSKRGGSANPGTTPTPTTTTTPGGSEGSSATGNALVSFAMGYLGYPYVSATHGPASFDCSGFTYWVVYNVTGQNIWYGLWTQISAGTPVDRNSLQPGDLVFFQNTYQAGLSHVGIYIGGDQFIHAENEDTGVRISSLSSSYYSSRYYGARRIG